MLLEDVLAMDTAYCFSISIRFFLEEISASFASYGFTIHGVIRNSSDILGVTAANGFSVSSLIPIARGHSLAPFSVNLFLLSLHSRLVDNHRFSLTFFAGFDGASI